jgi:hypothetical protein
MLKDREFWLLPQTLQATVEFNAFRDWLATAESPLQLEFVDNFLAFSGVLAVAGRQRLPLRPWLLLLKINEFEGSQTFGRPSVRALHLRGRRHAH